MGRYGGWDLAMKRDADLSRQILLFIEQYTPPQGGLDRPVEISGYDRPTVLAHTALLIEDGLVDGKVIEAMTGIIEVVVWKLTSAGHDAIDAARNDTAWQKAKKSVSERGVSVTFGLLVEVLKAEARKHIGLL